MPGLSLSAGSLGGCALIGNRPSYVQEVDGSAKFRRGRIHTRARMLRTQQLGFGRPHSNPKLSISSARASVWDQCAKLFQCKIRSLQRPC